MSGIPGDPTSGGYQLSGGTSKSGDATSGMSGMFNGNYTNGGGAMPSWIWLAVAVVAVVWIAKKR